MLGYEMETLEQAVHSDTKLQIISTLHSAH